MPTANEQTIWEGRPSQWTNFWWFVSCVLVLPIPIAIAKWLQIKCTTFSLTSQRFRQSRGVLNKTYDDLELYRVKDITMEQPLVQRVLGLGTIKMITSDATTPELVLPAIAAPLEVRDAIRAEVERMRKERGVRELDVHEDESGLVGGHH